MAIVVRTFMLLKHVGESKLSNLTSSSVIFNDIAETHKRIPLKLFEFFFRKLRHSWRRTVDENTFVGDLIAA